METNATPLVVLRRYCISNIFGDADYVTELEDVSPVVARFLILSYEVIMKMVSHGEGALGLRGRGSREVNAMH